MPIFADVFQNNYYYLISLNEEKMGTIFILEGGQQRRLNLNAERNHIIAESVFQKIAIKTNNHDHDGHAGTTPHQNSNKAKLPPPPFICHPLIRATPHLSAIF